MLELRDVHKSFSVIDRRLGLRGMLKDVVQPRRATRHALRGISASLGIGKRSCIAGRNGSGKSTLLKIVATAMRPSRGEVWFEGSNINRVGREYKRVVGAVFGHRGQLIWELAFHESLRFLSHVYGLDAHAFQARLGFLVERLDLGELINVPVREMSLGQRMRCEVAAALIHTPKLLILDEATIGLDVQIKNRIYSLLNEIAEEGTTIVFSTHDIHDITAIAERLIIIDDGRIVSDSTPREFLNDFTVGRNIKLLLRVPAAQAVRLIPGQVRILESDQHFLTLHAPSPEDSSLVVQCRPLMALVQEMTVEEEDLHDVLGRFYEEN